MCIGIIRTLGIHLDTSNSSGSSLINDFGGYGRVKLNVSAAAHTMRELATYKEGHEVVDIGVDGKKLLLVFKSL